jgi:hypothetical protein
MKNAVPLGLLVGGEEGSGVIKAAWGLGLPSGSEWWWSALQESGQQRAGLLCKRWRHIGHESKEMPPETEKEQCLNLSLCTAHLRLNLPPNWRVQAPHKGGAFTSF